MSKQKSTNTMQIHIAVQSIHMIVFNASILWSVPMVKLVNPQIFFSFFIHFFFQNLSLLVNSVRWILNMADKKNVNCDLCENPNHPFYCETCQINLCRACVGNHLLDSSVRHQIIPLEKRDSDLIFSICKEHSPKPCELHCEECDVFICIHCVTSSNHEDHKIEDAKRKFEINKDHYRNSITSFIPNI